MLGFFKSKPPKVNEIKDPSPKTSVINKLKQKFGRSRQLFVEKFAHIFSHNTPIDAAWYQALEDAMLQYDMGIKTSQEIIQSLKAQVAKEKIQDSKDLHSAFKSILLSYLMPLAKNMQLENHKPFVILMIGVNGAGKTTSIGKLCKHYQLAGKSIMLAAGDTFRAAAFEQLNSFANTLNLPIVSHAGKADSAAIVYDALQSASAKKVDLLIADTAGRLHTQNNLMSELKKIVQVLKKLDVDAPHEVLLVLDASLGQNALLQVEHFNQVVPITGIILSKIDGNAKGGSIFSIAKQYKIPIRFIGMGEKLEDLQVFDPNSYIEALFPDPSGEQT